MLELLIEYGFFLLLQALPRLHLFAIIMTFTQAQPRDGNSQFLTARYFGKLIIPWDNCVRIRLYAYTKYLLQKIFAERR